MPKAADRNPPAPRRALPAAGPWLRGLALFLSVVGARFWLIGHYAAPLPYWDQWDGIGAPLIKPWLEGRLDWHYLFTPHNEHRIFLTRLWTLGAFAANGQWDGLVEMALNAVFCGVSAVGLAHALAAAFGGARGRTVFLAVGVAYALPFGWENTFCGFQSQNYFLISFSLLALWGLGTRAAGSGGWWLGLTGLLLACLSMATGFLAAAAVFALGAMRLGAARRRPTMGEIVTLLVCLGATVLGWVTRVEVPAHASLKAESVSAFLWAAGRFLAWPSYGFPILAPLAILPILLLAGRHWRSLAADPRTSNGDKRQPAELLLVFGGWAILQAAAMAYGRGGHAAPPACRYMDLLAVGSLVNFLACAALADAARQTRWRIPALAVTALWTAFLTFGLYQETVKDFSGWMPIWQEETRRSEENTRGYVFTHNFDRYLADKPVHDLPYPDPARLASFLDDPTLRAVLPADIRLPLAPLSVATPETPAAFSLGGYPPDFGGPVEGAGWGSYYAASGTRAQGRLRLRFTSAATLPYLRFSFAGDLGGNDDSGLHFFLNDASGKRQTDWRPARPAGPRWHMDYLRRPGAGFVVEAISQSPARWFAFSAPVEVGFWSYWTGFALRRGDKILFCGLLLGALLEAAGWSRKGKAAPVAR